MKRLLFIFIFLSSIISFSQSIERDVFGSSGSVMTSTSLEISFTMGEPFSAMFTNNEIHTLGFQQTNQSAVSVVELNNVEVGLYPNPADDQITFISSLEEPFSYQVYDVSGRLILEGRHQQSMLSLNVSNLVEGKYFFEYTLDNHQTIITSFITIH